MLSDDCVNIWSLTLEPLQNDLERSSLQGRGLFSCNVWFFAHDIFAYDTFESEHLCPDFEDKLRFMSYKK